MIRLRSGFTFIAYVPKESEAKKKRKDCAEITDARVRLALGKESRRVDGVP